MKINIPNPEQLYERGRSEPTKRGPGRPAASTLESWRAMVLRSALAVFLEHGFQGASIQSIARLAGVSRDLIYRHYGSKEELFRAATGFTQIRLVADLRAAVDAGGTVEDVLYRAALVISSDTTSPESLPALRLIMAEAHRFPDVGRKMFDDARASLAPLVEYLELQKELGRLRLGDAFEAAFMLAQLAFGGVRIFLEPWPVTEEERARWVASGVAYVLDGWRAPTARRRPARIKRRSSRR